MMDLSTYPQTHTDRLLLIPDHIFELKRRNLNMTAMLKTHQ